VSKLFFEKNQTYTEAIQCKGVGIVSCVVTNEEKVYVNMHWSVTLTWLSELDGNEHDNSSGTSPVLPVC